MCSSLARFRSTVGILVFASGSAALCGQSAQLDPGVPAQRRIASGEVQTYDVALSSGQFFHAEVAQSHLDLIVRIGLEGAPVAEVDNVADREEPLALSVVTTRGGTYLLEIQMRGARRSDGTYRLLVWTPRPATAGDAQRVRAERTLADADRTLARGTAEATGDALTRYEELLPVWRDLGDRAAEAATLGRITDALGEAGEVQKARTRAEETLALWREIGDRRGEAAALARLGLACSEVGDQIHALEILNEALALRRDQEDAGGQARALNDIAVAQGAMGRKPEAIASYTQGLELARAAGDRSEEAMILKNRAVDYAGLGQSDRALADLTDALESYRNFGDRHLEGITQYSMGYLYKGRGELPSALQHYELALGLLRETGDKRFEGFTRNHMGLVHLAAGEPELALPDLSAAREILHDCGDRRAEAMIAANIGRAELERGHPGEARDRLTEALPLVRATSDRMHEAIVLLHLGRAERALGNLEAARDRLEESLSLTESVRSEIAAAGERASYMALIRDRYDLLIDVLMDLHARQPDGDWAGRALHVSERAKARSLVDLLVEARIDLAQSADAALLAREQALEEQIDARRRDDASRLARGAAARGAADSPEGRSLDALMSDYQTVEGQLRAASPRYAALARPQPLDWAGIRQVLDGETLLLEYSLGEHRSFVWAASRAALVCVELPGREVIETAARRLYEAWRAPDAVEPAETARRAQRLSRMLLSPLSDRLSVGARIRRLAVVSEGMLQYIPFAALPMPGAASRPLLSRFEVVHLPSATTLSVLRQQSVHRRPAGARVAVIADPVFEPGDPRVRGAHGISRASRPRAPENDALERSLQESGLRRLERLAASRREAETIAALAGPRQTFTALDFRASRAVALGPDVADAQIIHLASHGLLNSRHPELSGVVLSLVDRDGRPVDGFLQTRDIYRLKISANLVVLSACQTALGKDVRGEGLLGLSRGFMYAGALRVVASLWRVPDTATAELMRRFYRAILIEGLRPAEALRQAQSAVRAEKLWSSPYYWAAFVLQGDWN
ncbi:MAG TPA: CHAT domain-containing tetratricopeptide repeat protein [Thermoanaerobaculia bacterium]|nr:CHAT domain-containing tetratricopeptide repeat protein [Thermoanaerobaculia bacterium]